MSTIPTDILDAARVCAETVCRNLDYDDCTVEIAAIAKAINDERERSADTLRSMARVMANNDAEVRLADLIADIILIGAS